MGYRKDALKGISWFGLLRFFTKAIGFLEAIVLARILLPSQFGAYGVALLTLGVLEVLTETGVNIFLVQENEIDKYINSAWVVSICRGVLICITLFLLAPFIAGFFHSAESLSLLYLMSLVPLFRGFINPAVIKLQKELRFNKDFQYRFTVLFIDTIVSISLTYLLKNPIGIVFGLLVGVFVELLLSFFIVTPRPRFEFHKPYLVALFHRGKWVTTAGLFDYLFENIDNIVVGRLLGTGALGLYQMAYSLSVIPLSEIGKVFVHVTTPILVKITDDLPRFRIAFLQIVFGVVILLTPFVLVLIFFPHLFVIILGEKWTPIINILPLLAGLGLLRGLVNSSSALFLSLKKQQYIAYRTAVTIGGMLCIIIPAVNAYGLNGAAVSALFGTLLSLPIVLYYAIKLLR